MQKYKVVKNWFPFPFTNTPLTLKKNIKCIEGRIITLYYLGKSLFIKIKFRRYIVQAYLNINFTNKFIFNLTKELIKGDLIKLYGYWFFTKTNELTLKVQRLELLSKITNASIIKFNKNTIYSRVLDKSKLLFWVRFYLLKRGFVEVQTPILQMNPGGAVAKPFKTKSQTSRNKFYLRISLELYLKKLIILGLNKVFELGKVFRNEGLSTAHNFEFTVLEAYISFTCYKSLLKLTYCLICFLTIKLIGACLVLRYQKYKISVFNVWKIINYFEIIALKIDDKFFFKRTLREKLYVFKNISNKFILDKKYYKLNFKLEVTSFSNLIEKNLINPTFIRCFPKEVCPLARISKRSNFLIDTFELFIGGREIAPGYSEQNDPFIQSKFFKKQRLLKNTIYDINFLNTLLLGMPPSGGLGIGVDRLAMLIYNLNSIKNII